MQFLEGLEDSPFKLIYEFVYYQVMVQQHTHGMQVGVAMLKLNKETDVKVWWQRIA